MKRILILKACGNQAEPYECDGICDHAKLYGIEPICKSVSSNDDLSEILSSNGAFDFIYLSAHGNSDSFASEDRNVSMTWDDFAALLCSSDCMKEECILMLSCCRGGLLQVAYTLFTSCGRISYVLGPRQSLNSADMHICFGLFLYSIEIKHTDPIVACEKIKNATGQRFSCYDRQEEEMNMNVYNQGWYIHEVYKSICEEVEK